MDCKRCGNNDIRLYTHDVISVGSNKIGGEYAACFDCGLHVDVDEYFDAMNQEETEEIETDLEKFYELKQGSVNLDEFPENNIG